MKQLELAARLLSLVAISRASHSSRILVNALSAMRRPVAR